MPPIARFFLNRVLPLSFPLALATCLQAQSADGDYQAVLGRWNIVVAAPTGEHPAWFEVRKSGHRTLVGSFVGQFGSARPISKITFRDGVIRFVIPPQWEDRKTDIVIEGTVDGGTMQGDMSSDAGPPVKWTASRAPALDSDREIAWGKPLDLFNGKDLGGWQKQYDNPKNGWQVRDGVLVNAEPGNNLISQQKFNDFRLNAEFRFPEGSNSGIYLRGRYEVQIEDNYGERAECHKIGSIYGFLTPCVNASKPPGEWQTIDITLVGRRVTIVLNGERIVDRQIIPGITGGALDGDEGQPGPILIQGDHGPVEFRSLTLTPALE